MITTLLVTSAAALGLMAVISVDPIIMNKSTVPIFVELQGYNGPLVAKLLRDRIRTIARDAFLARKESTLSYFAEDEEALGELADQFKISGVVDALRQVSNLHSYVLYCYIADRGDDLKFSVKGETTTGELFYVSVDGSRDVPTLINIMAERLIERIEPIVLAVYHFRKEYASGNFEKSLPLLEHSFRVLPADYKGWPLLFLGRILYRQGNYDGAITKYREAQAFESSLPFIYSRWGEALVAKGDLEGGLAKIRQAIKVSSDVDRTSVDAQLAVQSATVYQLLGDVLVANGRDVEAREAYVEGLQSTPSHSGLQTSLAALYIRYGQFRPAIDLLQDALLQRQVDPRTGGLLTQALAGRTTSSLSSDPETVSSQPSAGTAP